VNQLILEGNITNPKNTVMEQVDIFYYNYKHVCNKLDLECKEEYFNMSAKLIENITKFLLDNKHGFDYRIFDPDNSNTSIYNKSLDKLENSSFVLVSKRIVFLRVNSTTIFGPHIVDIKVWEIPNE
jgi:hypothetical protein